MVKKTDFVLEKRLASDVYDIILYFRKSGITGYSIVKEVYGEEYRYTANVYDIIKELRDAQLIIEDTSPTSKNPKAQLIKPNMVVFIKEICNRMMPANTNVKLYEKQINDLATILNEVNPTETNTEITPQITPEAIGAMDVIQKRTGFVNVMVSTAIQLKFAAIMADEKARIPPNLRNLMGKSFYDLIIKMPKDTSNVLKQLIIPEAINNILLEQIKMMKGILSILPKRR